MKDENKTKKRLIDELVELRQRTAELETSETERKRAEEEITHRAKQLALINEVGQRIAPILELTELYQIVVEAVQEKFGYQNVTIFSVRENEVALEAISGPQAKTMPSGHTQKIGRGMVGRVAQTGETLLANDVTKEPRFLPLEFLKVAAELDVPIRLHGKTIGVLLVDSDCPNVFTEADVITLETISALAAAVEAKDPYTSGHSEKVTQFAIAIAEKMGLSNDEIENLRVAGLLHDIGKIGIPDSFLNKPARLTSAERIMVDSHPVIAAQIVGRIKALTHLVPIIRHHHERSDGQGYPDGLKGEEIPLGARILAVADGFEAMTSDRPYRTALSEEEALAELQKGAGSQWDPKVVGVFVKIYEEGALKHQASGQ